MHRDVAVHQLSAAEGKEVDREGVDARAAPVYDFGTMRSKLLGLLAVCALMMALASVADACPGCKDSVSDTAMSADGGPGGPMPGLPSGFNYSIYVMLFGLFSVMGLVAGIVIKGIRSSDRMPPPPGFPVSSPPRGS